MRAAPATVRRAIARLEFLRSRIEELETVVAAIARNPRRMLTAEETLLPYHRAKRATGPEILRSLRSGQDAARDDREPSRLPAALQGFLPERIRVRQRRSSLDLPEHRQMGACLRSWSAWLGLRPECWREHAAPDDTELRRSAGWAARCRRLARRVGAACGAASLCRSRRGAAAADALVAVPQ